MPCITYETPSERAEAARQAKEYITGPLHEEIGVLKAELAEREAMLCAVLSIYGPDMDAVYSEINWLEAGVTQDDMESWWKTHKRKDEERRAREADKREAARNKALKKLTHEERVLLGLEGKIVG